jgi:hypothetical protein
MERSLPMQESRRVTRHISLVVVIAVMVVIPSFALLMSFTSVQAANTSPEIVHVGVYVKDLNKFNVEEGTIEASFYLTLISDSNVSLDDIEIMNGHATSVDTIIDNIGEKEYLITATMTVDPDLRMFPFDRHTIPLELEPKLLNENAMILVIDQSNSGLNSESNLPGWEIIGTSSSITNRSYLAGEVPYSRAVFSIDLERDATSTLLKFFLPIMLIIVVALSSLMIKISSRLGLNASMFLAAVLIHWRVADAIPLVAYATFLDMFMIITYATLVMVLVSGLLILRFTEEKDMEKVGLVNRWSIRVIPVLSIGLYFLLFLSLLL